MNAAPGQQLDLFSAPADPAPLVDLLRVLTSTTAARPGCGCVCGYVQRVGVHVGVYCAGHGKWIAWLDADGRERAARAGALDV
jgi:flagellar basal body rod protein FlgF